MVSAKLMQAAIGAATLALFVGSGPAMAQHKGPAKGAASTKAQPAKEAAADKDKGKPEVWYKLCVDAPVVEQPKEGEAAKDGKDAKAAKTEPKKVNVCLTQADVRDKTTALLVGKVAIRQVEGQDKPQVLAMLPLGSVLPAGALVKVDDAEPIKLTYTHCHMEGCVAEATVDQSVVDQMKKGKFVGYFGKDLSGRTLSVPVPLEGFAQAYDGKPIPIAKYNEDQKKIADFIRQRLADLNEKAKEAADKKDDAADKKPAAKK
jgi:invasion protein IalB